jgi:putative hemolysin
MENVSVEIVLIIIAILANGLFAGSEIALVSSRVSRLVEFRERGTRGAATALALKRSPESFLATIQIAISLVSALASAVGGAAAVEELTPWVSRLPIPGATRWAEPVALGMVILVITFVSLVIGELTPKALALRNPERVACTVAGPVSALTRMFASIVSVLTASTNLMLRLLGQGAPAESTFVSEEEVKYLLREGTEKGVFEKLEDELVRSIFEFADRTVREIMVPRVNIVGLEVDTAPHEVLPRAAGIRYSRIVVYRGSVEHPVGVVAVRDLFRVVARGETPVLTSIMRPALFVPETARVSRLLRDFQRRRQYLALVVDEYGGVVGLVTIEDLLEEIVGEIREPGESVPAYVTRLSDRAYVVDGSAPVRELREALNISVPDSPDYTTAAGFVITALGSLPTPGVALSRGGWRWTVVDMDGPRVTKVKLEREDQPAAGAPGS